MNNDILENFEIHSYIKNYSKIFKVTRKTGDWIQVLCPYCDDAHRKSNITHGHFYIARYGNFSQCFRCETKTTTKKFLVDIGFSNTLLLNKIFKDNLNLTYLSKFKKGTVDNEDLNNKHISFKNKYPQLYKTFLNYTIYRISYSDHLFFRFYPILINDKLAVVFNNFNHEISTIRFISENNIKYFKLDHNIFYFFQDIKNYNSLVICEGSFDLINLYKYSTLFDKNINGYIALNGRSYISDISKIISNYCIIGHYVLNIILDKNVNNINNLKKNLKSKVNILNPEIVINFYIPLIGKDVSELNLLTKI